MYCKYCGKKINDNSNFCKFCGIKLGDNKKNVQIDNKDLMTWPTSQKDAKKIVIGRMKNAINLVIQSKLKKAQNDYVYFNFIPLKYRNSINLIAKWMEKIAEAIFWLLVMNFIWNQVSLDEGYKAIVYIIRFISYVAIPFLAGCIITEVCRLFLIKERNLKLGITKQAYLALTIISIALVFFASLGASNPSDDTKLILIGTLFCDSLSDSLSIVLRGYRVQIVLLINSFICYCFRCYFLIDDEEIEKS